MIHDGQERHDPPIGIPRVKYRGSLMSLMSGEQELGITENKRHNPGEWYAEVVQKAGLADYAPMGGSS